MTNEHGPEELALWVVENALAHARRSLEYAAEAGHEPGRAEAAAFNRGIAEGMLLVATRAGIITDARRVEVHATFRDA